jgi:AcrR family transcriptional regulator
VKTLTKSEHTHAAIVETALAVACREGLSKLSLSTVAKELGISKSGVFSRVGSLAVLQQEVVDAYERRFVEDVFLPAIKLPRGLPRLNAIVERWIARVCDRRLQYACLLVAGSFEYDDVDGPIGDRLRQGVLSARAGLRRAIVQAVDAAHLRPDTNVDQLVFETYSFIIGAMHDRRFLNDQDSEEHIRSAYARIISTYRSFNYREQAAN